MSEPEGVRNYRNLILEMHRIKTKYGWNSPEMDAHLDKMDKPWWDLTEEGRKLLDMGPDVGDTVND